MKTPALIDEYLKNNGLSLESFGSAEFGINRDNAIILLEMMSKSDTKILGIELWRYKNHKYKIDALGGWYANEKTRDEDFESAKKFLTHYVNGDDLVTIQFSA